MDSVLRRQKQATIFSGTAVPYVYPLLEPILTVSLLYLDVWTRFPDNCRFRRGERNSTNVFTGGDHTPQGSPGHGGCTGLPMGRQYKGHCRGVTSSGPKVPYSRVVVSNHLQNLPLVRYTDIRICSARQLSSPSHFRSWLPQTPLCAERRASRLLSVVV